MQGKERDWMLGNWEWLLEAGSLPALPLPLKSQVNSVQLFTGRCLLRGYSVTNGATTAGGMNILDGQDATGMAVAVLNLAAATSATANTAARGVLMEQGIYVQLLAATVTGAIWITPLWNYPKTEPGR